jgi:AcrR family transcriptional regulator
MSDQTARTSAPRRPRLSREFLENHRRRRYVDAVAELLHEFGREGPTVANIVRLAGTARNSFYEVFRSAEDCIGHGIGVAVGELFATLDGQDAGGEWLIEVQEAISGFYGAVVAQPMLAELLLVHAAASRVGHGRAAALAGVERFTQILGRGRAEAEEAGRRPLPTSAEEYFSRAIVTLAARRVLEHRVEALPGESDAMALLVGDFYLGPAAVDRIFSDVVTAPARG